MNHKLRTSLFEDEEKQSISLVVQVGAKGGQTSWGNVSSTVLIKTLM